MYHGFTIRSIVKRNQKSSIWVRRFSKIFKLFFLKKFTKKNLVTISVLGVTAIVLSQWERFAKPEYRTMRAGVFLSLGLSGVIPMLHTIIKNGTKGKFLDHHEAHGILREKRVQGI